MSRTSTVLVKQQNKNIAPPSVVADYQRRAVAWHDRLQFTPRAELVLKAGSFQDWVDEHVDWLDLSPRALRQVIPLGPNMELCLRQLPYGGLEQRYVGPFAVFKPSWQKTTLAVLRAGRTIGQVTFDGPVRILTLRRAQTTEGRQGGMAGDVWMSLTPGEVIGQQPGLRKARGHVLMAGLGLGWLARRVLERKQVKTLTVIEKDPHVAELVGKALTRQFGDRVKVIVADVWTWLNISKHPQTSLTTWLSPFDSLLFDIWEGANDASWDEQFKAVCRVRPDAWGWCFSKNGGE